jgi:hypothetical protein
MARKDYVWDAEAAQAIKEQELDKYYSKNKVHYDELAKGVWDNLQKISVNKAYLKGSDLAEILQPIIKHDKLTITGMKKRGLPEPTGRLGPQWYSWFTHHIVEEFMKAH